MSTARAFVLAQPDNADPLEALEGVSTTDWLLAGAVLVAGVVLSRVVKRLIIRVVGRGDAEALAAQVVARVVGYVFVVGGFVYALAILDVQLGPVLGALGLGGLALAFAAQTILENVFASVLLQTRRPFHRGDQIGTGELEGVVEDVNFRTVVLRTYEGEKVLIPCAQVLNNPIQNFTARRNRRTTLEVGVSYGTDLRRAQQVLLRAVSRVADVHAQPVPEAWVQGFGESSIDFAVRFWHDPEIAVLWRVRSEVAMAIKEAFDDAGIEIPFPQRTIGFLPGADRIDVRAAMREGTTVDGS